MVVQEGRGVAALLQLIRAGELSQSSHLFSMLPNELTTELLPERVCLVVLRFLNHANVAACNRMNRREEGNP